jgi:hypothetical protein
MVSARTMGIILAYSIPMINENLSSIDFLNNHVQKIDGRVPFFDDMSGMIGLDTGKGGKSKFVFKRSSIHMKDSWRVEVSGTADNTGMVYLSNSKRTGDGRYYVADLLWTGTGPYQIFLPTVYQDVMVSAVPGVGQTQFPSLKQWRKYRAPEPLLQGHSTGAMTFYNRYTGHWNYKRQARRGIRTEIVTSFHDYILLCVKMGVLKAIEMLENEGRLNTKINDVKVRAVR